MVRDNLSGNGHRANARIVDIRPTIGENIFLRLNYGF